MSLLKRISPASEDGLFMIAGSLEFTSDFSKYGIDQPAFAF
jgi:hypothetical protein